LNREINQQWPQLQKLLAIYGNSIETRTAGKSGLVLTLPFTTQQQLLLVAVKIRFQKPLPNLVGRIKTGLNLGTVTATTEQSKAIRALSPT
jgi:hypothetical protein